jgi:amidase
MLKKQHTRSGALARRSTTMQGPQPDPWSALMHRASCLAAVALCLTSCGQPSPSPTATAAQPAAPAIDVIELSATDARDRLASGALTSRALTQAYLDRIAAIDDAGPRLNAVIELNPNALGEADARDAERKAG